MRTIARTSSISAKYRPTQVRAAFPCGQAGAAPTGRLLKASKETPRPSPQSQSFSRSYGSILPTSLTYIILSTRGCSPWRPDAVMSTTRCANKSLQWIFKGGRGRTGQHQDYAALPASWPYRRVIRFQGAAKKLLKRKENSSRGTRSRLHFRLCCHTLSTSWCGNINPLPFR